RPAGGVDLRQLPAFAGSFHVEDPEVGTRQVSREPPTWEFTYRLKPRSRDVTEVPGLPFVYYRPDIPFPAKRCQVPYTDPIPLTVGGPEAVGVPVRAPEGAFALATGPGGLARQAPGRPPGPAAAGAIVLGPPLACAVWYFGWRRRYPDAGRQARQRRSRAARQALQALRGADPLPPGPQAERAAGAVAEYLRQRFDL